MKTKNNKGFTLAEMLIVVAITIILAGVSFIGVQSYQHSSTRLEFDGIAKEIFIAAQNHLTTAQGQGYLRVDSTEAESQALGTRVADGTQKYDDEYYFAYNRENSPYSTDPLEPQSLLDLMLPFGAIDETVRAGGTYIIHYQRSSGRVLDVFYSLPGKSSLLTVSGVSLDTADYKSLMTGYREGHQKDRERFTGKNGTGVIGWYGGEEGLPVGTRLKEPELVIHNEEVLWLEVTDTNPGIGSLKLTLTGKTSGAQRSFDLRTTGNRVEIGSSGGKIKVILDDITRFDDITRSGYHFADLLADDTSKHFIPGEDVVVEAVAYNNGALSNIASSGRRTTNSLFADYEESGEGSNKAHTALIENFRHFENLDKNISDFKNDGVWKKQDGTSFETVTKAKQIKDLTWTKPAAAAPAAKPDSFIEAVKYINGAEPSSIYNKSNAVVAADKHFYPVSPDYNLDYEGASYGQNHKVSSVNTGHNSAAGLFGTLGADTAVRNLELIDFDIKTSSGNAGALVGTANGTTITNVLAHNSAAGFTTNVTASSGDAGGLIGSATNCTVSKSAAALTVNGSGSAGGLIGSASTTTVSASYSGGHTYSDNPDYTGMTQPDPARNPYPVRYYNDKNEPIYNVTGGTTAGGLIGNMSDSSAVRCYSTCSAEAKAAEGSAGGFVGQSSNSSSISNSISNCYCTGLVKGTTVGAFAGSLSDAPTDCKYLEIINERQNVDEKDSTKILPGYHYLTALGDGTDGSITKLDQSSSTYQAFSGDPKTDWKDAHPYDSGLKEYYHDKNDPNKYKYNLETVEQLGAKLEENDDDKTVYFVKHHYGDWPAPEEFIFN